MLENDDNRARLLDPRDDPPAGSYRAQWNDDYHHAWHVLLTGENAGYYRDYQDAPRAHRARAGARLRLSGRAVAASRRPAARRAERASAAAAFVNFLQNHDQIGNRPMGERLTVLATPAALEAALAVLLLQPVAAAAVHGRGMGRDRAVPVLLRFQRRAGRGGAQGPAAGICRGLCHARRTTSPIRWRERRATAPCSIGTRSMSPSMRERLALMRALLTARTATHIVPLLGRHDRRRRRRDRRRRAARRDGAPARRASAAARQSSASGAAAPDALIWGEPIWGGAPPRELPPWSVYAAIGGGMMPPAIPLATYRLQLTKDFGFDDAAALVPYLKELGISHLYASPFLKARPGSTHGYDIVDHDRLNPELGGEEGFARLSDALKRHDLGLILDFVPNHMGVGHADNAWWLDVLEWGQKSPHARVLRHRLGRRCRIAGIPACCCRSSAGLTAKRCRAGEIELKYDADGRQLRGLVFRPQAADQSAALRRDAAHHRRRRPARSDDPAGHELIALAHDYRDPSKPVLSRRAGAQSSGWPASTARAEVIERGLVGLSRRQRRRRRARCTACSNASTIASPTGASPSRR